MKQKTKSISLLIILLLISSLTFLLTGCLGKEENKVEIVNYEIQQEQEQVYYVNSTFEISRIKLKLFYDDKTEKTITLDASMVKQMPDMTTPGEKTITIVYEGKEYTFKINVIELKEINEQEEMINKINQFISEYNENLKQNNVKLSVGYDINLTSTWLKDKETIQESGILENITDFELEVLNNTTHTTLEGLINILVNTTAQNITTNQIVDASKLKAQIDFMQYMSSICEKLETLNYEAIFAMVYDESHKDFLSNRGVNDEYVLNQICDHIKTDIIDEIYLDEDYATRIMDVVRPFITKYYNFTTKYDLLKTLNQEVLVEDCYSLIDNILEISFEYVKEYYILNGTTKQDIVDGISGYIKNIILFQTSENATLTQDIRSFVEKYYEQFMNYDSIKNIDLAEFVEEFAILVDNYANPIMETVPLRLMTKLLTNDLTEENFVDILKDLVVILDSEDTRVSNATTTIIAKQYVENIIDIYSLIIYGSENDTFIDELETKLKALLNFEKDYLSSLNLRFLDDIYPEEIFALIYSFVQDVKETNVQTAILNKVEEMCIIENIISILDSLDETYIDENLQNAICGAIYEKLRGQEVSKANRDEIIKAVCNSMKLDAEFYIAFYDEAGYAPILKKYFENMLASVEVPENAITEFNNIKEKLLDLALYVDKITVDGFDYKVYNAKQKLLLEAIIDYCETDIRYERELKLYSLELIVIDLDLTVTEKIQRTIDLFKVEIEENLMLLAQKLLNIEETSEDYALIKNFVKEQLARISNGEITFDSFKENFITLLTNITNKDVQTVVSASTIMYYILTDADVDYNELFANIELPNEIKDIDFNQLIAKLKSKNTYENIFLLKDVCVDYLTDAQGNITNQVMKITLEVDFDAMIATQKGEISLTLDLNFAE